MKTYEELKKEQDELDEEAMLCPVCGIESTYGEIREIGSCMECYYKWTQKEKKK